MLLSDSGSNVLLYLSGHGGDGFLKFRDVCNVQSHDLSDALETMRTQQRFKEMLVLVDTCQAATIPEPFHTPRVTSMTINNLTAVRNAVIGGVGIAVLPDYMVQSHHDLVRILPQADMPELECYLVYAEEMKNVARIQVFRDFLVANAQRWDY